MRSRRFPHMLSGLLLVVGSLVASPALAVTMMTPHIYSANNFVACTITNYGESTITVRIDQITYDGIVQTTTLDVEPLKTQTHSFSGTPPESGSCRFTFEGSKRKVRAAVMVIDHLGAEGTKSALPAS